MCWVMGLLNDYSVSRILISIATFRNITDYYSFTWVTFSNWLYNWFLCKMLKTELNFVAILYVLYRKWPMIYIERGTPIPSSVICAGRQLFDHNEMLDLYVVSFSVSVFFVEMYFINLDRSISRDSWHYHFESRNIQLLYTVQTYIFCFLQILKVKSV